MESTSAQHFLTHKHIIVVGAGVSGLTFCIALQKFLEKNDHNIDPPPRVVVYECDTSTNVTGREDYSLSIHGDSLSGGLQTLHKLDMLDEMLAESNPGKYFTIFNADFSPIMEFRSPSIEGLPRSNIHIARSKLYEIFAKHIPPSTIVHWNCGVQSAQELEDGKVLVDLMDGRQEQCDILIVADGSNSEVRQVLRPQHELSFAGVVSIGARTGALDKIPPPLDVTWGGALGGDGHFLFIALNDRTSTLWSVSYLSDTLREVKPAGTLSETEIDELLAEVQERTKQYGEPMSTLLKETLRSSIFVFNANDMIPFRNHGSIIFIGDAQHATNPFAGNGANLAILDGYQLAEILIMTKNLQEAILAYDDISIPRSTKAVSVSRRNIAMGHSQGIRKHLWVALFKIVGWYFGFTRRLAAQ